MNTFTRNAHRVILTVVLPLLVISPASAVWANPAVFEVFRVPSGIHLGQPAREVRNILERENATFINEEQTPEGEVWTVEDLFIRNFHSGKFAFEEGKLSEIEFRYGQEDWSEQKLRRLMYDYKILLEHKLGFADDQHKEAGSMGPVQESTEAYTWVTAGGNVQLVLFTASREDNAYRVLSAHFGHELSAPGRGTSQAPLPDVDDVGDGMMLFIDDPDLPPAAEKVDMPDEPLPAELFSTPDSAEPEETDSETDTDEGVEAEQDEPDEAGELAPEDEAAVEGRAEDQVGDRKWAAAGLAAGRREFQAGLGRVTKPLH